MNNEEYTAYTPVETDTDIPCDRCVHKEVCIYYEQYANIWRATQRSNGIQANIEYGRTVDLNSMSYIRLNISCKHYKKKAEVAYRGF